MAVQVLAMDALRYQDKATQFQEKSLNRELLKAFAGFTNSLPSIATGNWGCGAFNGIVEIKCKTKTVRFVESSVFILNRPF